ncbi:MBL fold metallo-hydrolase [Metaclostridioides mangenotii]|uniref:Glyoxylase-like metal-dependent hydrolase (Beta-lactamase superfamily II) n=1 Tax=Metaclostridioides mangenotii TaxID=1540 RepID=A0ABS4EAY8_9FIRM|nr:MBL fold metallo-hydrolase [Clostridioides mangenotii]MBP1855095.1 glyoxylase-like metal-dependent hydrolase (beta-lactamase superfamily II) [Clostridioides mangenotii]
MNKLDVLKVEFEFNRIIDAIYPVILRDDNDMILIDCGYPNFLTLIEERAIKNGIDLSKLTKLIITHHDFDHMGSAADFKRKYPNVKILSSIIDEKYISGKEKSLRLQQAESVYDKLPEEQKEGAMNFQKMLESIENIEVDMLLKDGDKFDWCGGMEIIETPGHMPGHISIYAKESKTLISGDALVLENDKLAIANPNYTLNIKEAKESVYKLLNYDIDKIVCYHGGIYTEEIKSSLKRI